jgi:signal-transduction protein with cAMP-binding, CBS, and nucleotidyltransferase domain
VTEPSADDLARRLVTEVCAFELAVAAPGDHADAAACRMRDAGVGTLVVVDANDRPLGIVTDRDLAIRCVADCRDPSRTTLGELMSNPVAWIHAGATVGGALDEMTRLGVRRLAVIDDRERLIGVLALDDVFRASHAAGSLIGKALRAAL